MAWNFTSAVSAGKVPFSALFWRRKSGGEEKGFIPPFGAATGGTQRLPQLLRAIIPKSCPNEK